MIYLLVGEDFEGNIPNHPRLIWRRVHQQFLDVCIVGKGEEGYLCLDTQGVYPLADKQRKDLFQYMLYRFWHEAVAERLPNQKEQDSVLERPEDILIPMGTVRYLSRRESDPEPPPCKAGVIGYRCRDSFKTRLLPIQNPNLPASVEEGLVWTDLGPFCIKVDAKQRVWLEFGMFKI